MCQLPTRTCHGTKKPLKLPAETTSPESEESIHGWTTPTDPEQDDSYNSTSRSDSEDDDSDGDDGHRCPTEAEKTENISKDEDEIESESEADDAERKSTIVKGAIKPPKITMKMKLKVSLKPMMRKEKVQL